MSRRSDRGRLRIKICCLRDEDELGMAVAAGATHLGLVGPMPSGPGPIDEATIRRLAALAPDGTTTVLLTARTDAAGIVDHVRSAGTAAVQIVASVDADVRRRVRHALPAVRILQVVHVEGPESVDAAIDAAVGTDHVLLDSGRPGAAIPELGGTGRTHDWSVSRRIVERVAVPVFLAGGLRPDNVADAIRAVRPAGVDVCSGLRDADGRLDATALDAFVRSVRAA